MRYRFHTVDVFTKVRFGGNQLAVFPEAQGLAADEMLSITREFNFSETTFVLPPEQGDNDARVRIFTPDREIPFAGHPNIGTAHVLASTNGCGPAEFTLKFEEIAGVVPVRVRSENGIPFYCELTAPQDLELGPELNGTSDVGDLARAISLDPEDILTDSHFPRRASVGLPFLMAELRDRSALSRSQVNPGHWRAYIDRAGCDAIHLYTKDTGEQDVDVRCRMFATMGDVREDPATGSANCALAGLLAALEDASTDTFSYRIAQGVEMGRPSELAASVDKLDGEVVTVRIGGASVDVTEGSIEI